jgi:hypothetical protein
MLKKIILGLAIIILLPHISLAAWNDCPYDEKECEYPGECPKYLDTDEDSICDHSQPVPEDRNVKEIEEEQQGDLISGKDLKEKTVAEIAQLYNISKDTYAQELTKGIGYTIKPTDSFKLLHDNYNVEPSYAKDIAIAMTTNQEITIEEKEEKISPTYHLIQITLVLTILYLITYFLSKFKIITSFNHKKIWNILLTLTFLASGLLGILLIIKINFNLVIPLPFNILFWHVDIGIAMFVICIFHIIWHWPYYKNIFKF